MYAFAILTESGRRVYCSKSERKAKRLRSKFSKQKGILAVSTIIDSSSPDSFVYPYSSISSSKEVALA